MAYTIRPVDLLPEIARRVALEDEDEEEDDRNDGNDTQVHEDDPTVDSLVHKAQKQYADGASNGHSHGCINDHAEVPIAQRACGLVFREAEREMLARGAAEGTVDCERAVCQIGGLYITEMHIVSRYYLGLCEAYRRNWNTHHCGVDEVVIWRILLHEECFDVGSGEDAEPRQNEKDRLNNVELMTSVGLAGDLDGTVVHGGQFTWLL